MLQTGHCQRRFQNVAEIAFARVDARLRKAPGEPAQLDVEAAAQWFVGGAVGGREWVAGVTVCVFLA
jgi:hypothetical protein